VNEYERALEDFWRDEALNDPDDPVGKHIAYIEESNARILGYMPRRAFESQEAYEARVPEDQRGEY